MNARILASLVRITGPDTAKRLSDRILFDVRPLAGNAVAGQVVGCPGAGIVMDEAWIRDASDEALDQTLSHEIFHAAFGPTGGPVLEVLRDNGMMRPRHVPPELRDEYNRSTDAVIEQAIAARATPAAARADAMLMKLWWLRGGLAHRVVAAVTADPPLDPASATLEDDVEARLPDLGGVSAHLVVADLVPMLRSADA